MSPRWKMTSRLLQEQRSPGSCSGRKDWMVGNFAFNPCFHCSSHFQVWELKVWQLTSLPWNCQEVSRDCKQLLGKRYDMVCFWEHAWVLFREKLRPTFFWLPSQLRFTLAMALSQARYASWKPKPSEIWLFALSRPTRWKRLTRTQQCMSTLLNLWWPLWRWASIKTGFRWNSC